VKPRSLHEDGIFNDNDDPSIHQGIGAGDLPAKEIEVQKMVESHATAEYLHFLKHPELRCFVRQLMGWDHELLLRRTMLRHNVPGGRSTGIHYDKLFLRGGDAFFLTAWVPIGKTTWYE